MCVPYALETDGVLSFENSKELEQHLVTQGSGSAYMYTAIHFKEKTVGYTIMKNGRFLYQNPYFYDIHSAFTDRLEDLYQKKRLEAMNQTLQEQRQRHRGPMQQRVISLPICPMRFERR